MADAAKKKPEKEKTFAESLKVFFSPRDAKGNPIIKPGDVRPGSTVEKAQEIRRKRSK